MTTCTGLRKAASRGDSGRAMAVVCTVATMWAVVSCGGSDSSSAVSRAEAKVALKENALADAQSTLADASRQFCEASHIYVVALDRYGDVLRATEPTVGDVKDAGSDLDSPRADALAGAEAALEERIATATREPSPSTSTHSEAPTSPFDSAKGGS